MEKGNRRPAKSTNPFRDSQKQRLELTQCEEYNTTEIPARKQKQMETLGPKNTREQKGRGSMSKVKERISELENTFFKHTQVSRNLERN